MESFFIFVFERFRLKTVVLELLILMVLWVSLTCPGAQPNVRREESLSSQD